MANNRNFPSDAFMTNYLQGGDYEKVSGRLGMESQKTRRRPSLSWAVSIITGTTFSCSRDHCAMRVIPSLAWIISGVLSRRLPPHGACPSCPCSRIVDGRRLEASLLLRCAGRSGFDRYISLAKYSGYGEYYSDQFGWLQGYGPGNNPNLTWLGRSRSLTTWVSTIPCSNLACLVAWTSLSATVKT